jgi:hypothetical protein
METTVYEIIPSPLYGWNFKNKESRHVIKYDNDKKELINYAVIYCKTHRSELMIYNYIHEMEKVMSFEVEEHINQNNMVIL